MDTRTPRGQASRAARRRHPAGASARGMLRRLTGALLLALLTTVSFATDRPPLRLTHPDPQPGDRFGIHATTIADINDNGHADFLVGGSLPGPGSGRAFVFDGLTGEHLRTHTPPDADYARNFSSRVYPYRNADSDPLPDYIIRSRSTSGDSVKLTIFGARSGLPIGAIFQPPGAIGLWNLTDPFTSDWVGYLTASNSSFSPDSTNIIKVGNTTLQIPDIHTYFTVHLAELFPDSNSNGHQEVIVGMNLTSQSIHFGRYDLLTGERVIQPYEFRLRRRHRGLASGRGRRRVAGNRNSVSRL